MRLSIRITGIIPTTPAIPKKKPAKNTERKIATNDKIIIIRFKFLTFILFTP